MEDKPEENQEKPQHYFLMAGQVLYVKGSDKRTPPVEYSRNLNTLLMIDTPYVNRAEIGKCQQAMQIRFMKEYGAVGIKIIDVFIMGINYIGHMTDTQFQGDFQQLVEEQAAAEAAQETKQ